MKLLARDEDTGVLLMEKEEYFNKCTFSLSSSFFCITKESWQAICLCLGATTLNYNDMEWQEVQNPFHMIVIRPAIPTIIPLQELQGVK